VMYQWRILPSSCQSSFLASIKLSQARTLLPFIFILSSYASFNLSAPIFSYTGAGSCSPPDNLFLSYLLCIFYSSAPIFSYTGAGSCSPPPRSFKIFKSHLVTTPFILNVCWFSVSHTIIPLDISLQKILSY
jgi:hypothetical protein